MQCLRKKGTRMTIKSLDCINKRNELELKNLSFNDFNVINV